MTGLQRASHVGTCRAGRNRLRGEAARGPIVVLDGIAGLIWDEAFTGDRETITERVAEATDAAPDTIRADVDAFVADLVARGLLESREALTAGGRLPPAPELVADASRRVRAFRFATITPRRTRALRTDGKRKPLRPA